MNFTGVSEREYWASVANQPGLFISDPTLTALEAYLHGYDAHSARHGGPGLDGWRDWLVAKRGHDCNHGWNGQVRHIALPDGWEHWDLPADQEQHVIHVLFELLDEFLAEQESEADTA